MIGKDLSDFAIQMQARFDHDNSVNKCTHFFRKDFSNRVNQCRDEK